MYFVIRNSDGDTSVEMLDKDTLLGRITPDEEYGNKGFITKIKEQDTNYWGDDILIIKGDIVSPEVEQTITKYTIA